jgi:hypothetical protein
MERGVLKISYQREIIMSTFLETRRTNGRAGTAGGQGESEPLAMRPEAEQPEGIQGIRRGVPAVLFS